jgi:thioredoxin-like negative regulator of GroEL
MAKPIVDGIERDLEGQARVVRLSVMSDVGSRAAQRYGVRGVPTVLVFDGSGNLVEQRAGVPDRKQVVSQVMMLVE